MEAEDAGGQEFYYSDQPQFSSVAGAESKDASGESKAANIADTPELYEFTVFGERQFETDSCSEEVERRLWKR
jgi:hypothetical protein